jgi:zinc/manganese transport system permease protein
MIELLLPAFLLSVVLVGIHAFYGLEIIRRGIIFTDLAIGQMAALGAALSILFFHGTYLYPMSLAFALIGGGAVALASRREVHLEAFIGLLYALATSATVLTLSKSPHGTEALQALLASDILFTLSGDILAAAMLYFGIGALLFWLYRQGGGAIREFLFFLTFAVTVASSVKLAGVLVVFAMLIAPPFIVLKAGVRRPLLYAWGVGTLLNMAGVGLSYAYDFPTGYMIVFVHAVAAIIVSFIYAGRKP